MFDENFEKVMEFLFPIEGGYSNSKIDRGGATNLGITHTTYDNYRKSKGLPTKDIRNITRDEAKQIYYDWYWKAAGADKQKDLRDAYMLFDTAVQYGDYNARKMWKNSGENFYNMLKLRENTYRREAKKFPEQAGNLEGWLNRVKYLERDADQMIEKGIYTPPYINDKTPFDSNYQGSLQKVPADINTQKVKNKYQYLLNKQKQITGGASYIDNSIINNIINEHTNNPNYDFKFTPEDISNMSSEEFDKYEPIIMEHLKKGLIKNDSSANYAGYTNPITADSKIFSREDIANMSGDDYTKNETAIMSQLNSIGIPTNADLQYATENNGGTVYVQSYTRQDGTKVRGYYRSK